MTPFKVLLNSPDLITRFVSIVMYFPFDVDLHPESNNRTTVDAKSVVGVFSLDVSKPLVMIAHTTEVSDLLQIKDRLSDFLVN